LESTFQKKEILVTEIFIRSLVEKYGRHTVYTGDGTWYHEACNVIGLKHYLHLPLEKSLMERVINSILRIELNIFDDYYPCIQKKTMNVTYFRYKIEYNSLYIYNYTISTRDNYFVNQL